MFVLIITDLSEVFVYYELDSKPSPHLKKKSVLCYSGSRKVLHPLYVYFRISLFSRTNTNFLHSLIYVTTRPVVVLWSFLLRLLNPS